MMISIIVPVFNVEDYLRQCLDSIQNQTYQDFEVILVDDGSTDSSGLICDEFVSKDERFTVIHQSNKGVSSARNVALERIEGSYVLMVDGDDIIHSRMLDILLSLIQSGDYGFSMCSHELIVHTDSIISDSPISKQAIPQVLSQDDCMRGLFVDSNLDSVVVWNKLYRSDVLEGLFFDYDAGQDVEFNCKVYQCINKAIFLPERLYFYIHRPGSFQHRQYSRRFFDVLLTIEACLNKISKNQLKYRSYCLQNLYRMMLSRLFDSRNTPFSEYVQGLVFCIRERTVKELLASHDILFFKKLVLAFFSKHHKWNNIIRIVLSGF